MRPDLLLAGAGVWALQGLMWSLPPQAILGAADLVGSVWRFFDGRRRRRVRENLRVAYGDRLDPRTLPERVATAFRAMARVPAEVILARRHLAGSGFRRRVRLVGDWDRVVEDVRAGRSGVVVTGHLGNWEVGAMALRRVVPRLKSVVRPIDTALLEEQVVRFRGGPEGTIAKHGAVQDALRALREGWWIALLADQDAGRRGAFVPFFGLPASTTATPAVLAMRSRSPIYVGACLRRPGGPLTFEVHLRRIAGPEEPEGRAARRDPGRIVEAWTSCLEGWIRADPGQYNWLHRRWKTRPAGEAPSPRVPAYARVPPP
jgi:KDO2-lipid IV(A) lauroyltransferase